jgi:3-hydroxyacyl-CoA dehydrogenase
MTNDPIQRVAVIGTGVIGASWATLFLARGLDVTAFDVLPNAEAALRDAIDRHWPIMQQLGLADGASVSRLKFCASVADAVKGTQFVQESGPERLDFKLEVFAAMDAATTTSAVLASSSSTLGVSEFQNACSHPERVVLGHPFNPPHLIPLVEVAGGQHTGETAIATAIDFYAACGKRPIRLRKEIRGHIANRLQAALWQEAFHLVESGVATVADIDDAIAYGPGLRWALLGPFLNMHLSGGQGGMAHVLSHLGPAIESIWHDLGKVSLSQECKAAVIAGVNEQVEALDLAAIVRRRDQLLIELLRAKEASVLS